MLAPDVGPCIQPHRLDKHIKTHHQPLQTQITSLTNKTHSHLPTSYTNTLPHASIHHSQDNPTKTHLRPHSNTHTHKRPIPTPPSTTFCCPFLVQGGRMQPAHQNHCLWLIGWALRGAGQHYSALCSLLHWGEIYVPASEN